MVGSLLLTGREQLRNVSALTETVTGCGLGKLLKDKLELDVLTTLIS